jgi:hypothetical protein
VYLIYIFFIFLLIYSIIYVCLFVHSKMPEREDDHLTPATRLLEKRREMAEVEQALAAQKEVILKFANHFTVVTSTL